MMLISRFRFVLVRIQLTMAEENLTEALDRLNQEAQGPLDRELLITIRRCVRQQQLVEAVINQLQQLSRVTTSLRGPISSICASLDAVVRSQALMRTNLARAAQLLQIRLNQEEDVRIMQLDRIHCRQQQVQEREEALNQRETDLRYREQQLERRESHLFDNNMRQRLERLQTENSSTTREEQNETVLPNYSRELQPYMSAGVSSLRPPQRNQSSVITR